MKNLQTIIDSSLASSFGETIFHSFWQGAIILILFLVLTQKWKSANFKINLGLIALFTQLFISALTFIYLESNKSEITSSQLIFNTLNTGSVSFFAYISKFAPFLFPGWCVGFAFIFVRYISSLLYIQNLKNSQHYILKEKSQKAWDNITSKLYFSLNNVEVLETTKVKSAMVIGFINTMILLPIAMINYLTVEELEMVIAHEIAHIKRNDYFINILQTLAESFFFFHPVYWFIGNQIRTNRELACDELASEWTGNGLLLAKTIAKIQVTETDPSFAMTFGKKNMPTLTRIQKLLGYQYDNQKNRLTAVVLMISMAALFGFMPQKEAKKVKTDTKKEIAKSNGITKTDTSIVEKHNLEIVTNNDAMKINTDNYKVKIDDQGIILNGKKVEMNQKEAEEFKFNWEALMQSHKDLESVSKKIELESSKIEKYYDNKNFNFDPSDDPNFKAYIKIIEENSEKIGELSTKLTEDMMKLDVNAADYNAKTGALTKTYTQEMKVYEKSMKETEPKMQQWQKNMEAKQKEIEKQIQIPTQEIHEKIKIHTDEIEKISEKMELQREKIMELLPAEVQKEMDGAIHINFSYPSPPPTPPSPPKNLKPVAPPVPPVTPRATKTPVPPKPPKEN